MPHYPSAYCPSHGLFEAIGTIAMTNSEVTIIGSSTDCPRCGSRSEILPGKYTSKGDSLSVLFDTSISSEALAAIQAIVFKLQQNEISVADAKVQVEKIAPKAGRLFDVASWDGGAKATLYASIIGAIAIIVVARMASSSSQSQVFPEIVVERVIEKSIDRLSDSAAPIFIPFPTPRPERKR